MVSLQWCDVMLFPELKQCLQEGGGWLMKTQEIIQLMENHILKISKAPHQGYRTKWLWARRQETEVPSEVPVTSSAAWKRLSNLLSCLHTVQGAQGCSFHSIFTWVNPRWPGTHYVNKAQFEKKSPHFLLPEC